MLIFSTINLIYQVTEKPYSGKLENMIEVFNEICILICCYLEMTLLNVGAPIIFLVKMGEIFMLTAMCNVIINLIIFVMKFSS